jgi:hypothetical protein
MQNLVLRPLFKQVQLMEIGFDVISYSHIYKESNMEANALSKQALEVEEGT